MKDIKKIINFKEEDLIKNWEESIQDYEARLNALKNIKRLTKKDGGDFANLSKNFEGGKIQPKGILSLGYEMTIYYMCGYSHKDFSIYVDIDADKLSEEEKSKRTVASYDFYNKPKAYLMTPDEICDKIKDTISEYQVRIKGLKDTIEVVKSGNCEIVNHIKELRKEFDMLDKKGNSLTDNRGVEYNLYYGLFNLFY